MILYHFTRPPEGTQIVEEGRFLLSPAHTLSSEINISGKHLYFLSTARTRQNAYTGEKPVMFELDGTKLKSKYKSMPVHFWSDIKLSESEERFVSNSPAMPIRPYVKAIHVWISPNWISEIRKMVIAAKKHNIPIYGYATHQDMISTQASRRVPFTGLDEKKPAPGRNRVVTDPILRELREQDRIRTSKNVRPFVTLLHIAENNLWKKALPHLDKESAEILGEIAGAGGSLAMRAIVRDLKDRSMNAHYEGPKSRTARLANDLALRLRKLGITLNDLPAYIKEKYEATQ